MLPCDLFYLIFNLKQKKIRLFHVYLGGRYSRRVNANAFFLVPTSGLKVDYNYVALSSGESLIKIGSAVSQISPNKQKDRQSNILKSFVCALVSNKYALEKYSYFETTDRHFNFIYNVQIKTLTLFYVSLNVFQ